MDVVVFLYSTILNMYNRNKYHGTPNLKGFKVHRETHHHWIYWTWELIHVWSDKYRFFSTQKWIKISERFCTFSNLSLKKSEQVIGLYFNFNGSFLSFTIWMMRNWLWSISERVFEVMHSQCKGTAYMADTFPTTTCTSQQLHKLGKIRCIALSQKPSLGVLLTFALANLFLLTIIVGKWKQKMCVKCEGIFCILYSV